MQAMGMFKALQANPHFMDLLSHANLTSRPGSSGASEASGTSAVPMEVEPDTPKIAGTPKPTLPAAPVLHRMANTLVDDYLESTYGDSHRGSPDRGCRSPESEKDVPQNPAVVRKTTLKLSMDDSSAKPDCKSSVDKGDAKPDRESSVPDEPEVSLSKGDAEPDRESSVPDKPEVSTVKGDAKPDRESSVPDKPEVSTVKGDAKPDRESSVPDKPEVSLSTGDAEPDRKSSVVPDKPEVSSTGDAEPDRKSSVVPDKPEVSSNGDAESKLDAKPESEMDHSKDVPGGEKAEHIREMLRRPNTCDFPTATMTHQPGVPKVHVLIKVNGVSQPAMLNMTAEAAAAAGLVVLDDNADFTSSQSKPAGIGVKVEPETDKMPPASPVKKETDDKPSTVDVKVEPRKEVRH